MNCTMRLCLAGHAACAIGQRGSVRLIFSLCLLDGHAQGPLVPSIISLRVSDLENARIRIFVQFVERTSNLVNNSRHIKSAILNSKILTTESLSATLKTSEKIFFAIIYCIIRAWPIFIPKSAFFHDILLIIKFSINNEYNSSSKLCRIGI